jgi:hypothetical protein
VGLGAERAHDQTDIHAHKHVQEVSTMIRYDQNPIIFLINNKGRMGWDAMEVRVLKDRPIDRTIDLTMDHWKRN